jgi:membrane-bound metal-dependent hydrolase YbcI (DUF457 family)
MFIGHFALGFALKRTAPRTNLGWLIASVLFLDLVWPIFVLLGIERVEVDPGNTVFTPLDFVSYPYSHSLAAAFIWSLLFGAAYFVSSKYKAGSVVVAIGVLSHWILDMVVHRPDLPLYPGSDTKLGFGVWNSFLSTLVIEIVMFGVGIWLYSAGTRAIDRVGKYAFFAFVVFLVIVYLANAFGPPPPSTTAVAIVAALAWLFPFWAAWFDRHRTAIG